MPPQSDISSFFKRKEATEQFVGHNNNLPRKRARIGLVSNTAAVPLSERSEQWKFHRTKEYTLTPQKQAARQNFLQRFGDRSRQTDVFASDIILSAPDADTTPAEEDSEEGTDIEAGKFSLARFANRSTQRSSMTSTSRSKLTPLEEQYTAIKAANPNTLLLVEVGYKFRFFDEDAKIASRVLGVATFKQRAFWTASIPIHRLDVHVHRLVLEGYKVGIVRQIETAALKASGAYGNGTKNAPFERRLCEVYSKGTYLANTDGVSGDSSEALPGGWILAIAEKATSKEGVEIGILAVRIESSEVVYDHFDDPAHLRRELEQRLLMLEVVEVIVIGDVSSASQKVLKNGERRIEKILPVTDATTFVQYWYQSRYLQAEDSKTEALSRRVLRLNPLILQCLSGQMKYLAEFKLDSIFMKTDFFAPLFNSKVDSQCHMLLPATTIASLELFTNSTDGTQYGSLFWVMNRTRTLPGRRLLRRWLARPLLNLQDIRRRQQAIDEMLNCKGSCVEKLRTMLKSLPDIEKGLSKIFHGKCSRPEMLSTLQAFSRISRTFDAQECFNFDSEILVSGLSSFATITDLIDGFLSEFHHTEAAKDDKFQMFKESETQEAISDHKMGILIIESDLREHLEEIKKILKRKHVEYVTVAGIEFLIELKNSETKLVPKSWLKSSATKYVSRFHTPTVLRLISEREQRKESLALECDAAYSDFLGRISDNYDILREIATTTAELDCLLSLATISARSDFVKPKLLESGRVMQLKESRHPVVEQISTEIYVPNSVNMTEDLRVALITGPNMGGKSSYIKQIALCTVMAQMGCYVPALEAEMSLVDAIYTRMGASDDWSHRESTFMVELHECSDIMKNATESALVILDELGRGTSTFDGLAISYAVLDHFIFRTKCRTFFVTHYPELGSFNSIHPDKIRNWHMGHLEEHGRITFLYKLIEGIAHRSYGLNVARLAGLESSILSKAEEVSTQFEKAMRKKTQENWIKRACQLFSPNLEEYINIGELQSVLALLISTSC